MKADYRGVTIEVLQGDITTMQVDAIVNAANRTLRGGGGVDGAIHRAGGEGIVRECIQKYPDGIQTGQAVFTMAGNLPAKFVIHAVGPVWKGGQYGEQNLLKDTYANCMRVAQQLEAESIAFPAISTGIYGFPIESATRVAVETVLDYLHEGSAVRKVVFCTFSQRDLNTYESILANKLLKS